MSCSATIRCALLLLLRALLRQPALCCGLVCPRRNRRGCAATADVPTPCVRRRCTRVHATRQIRYVKVKDYRLGIPHMVITVAIVIKIFIITLVMDGGFL